MWNSRSNRDRKSVVCIACGDSLLRSEVREYDKEGDRWTRRGKEFEHLCKECYRELTHQPRDGLEELLVTIEEDGLTQEEFLDRYLGAIEEQESTSERER